MERRKLTKEDIDKVRDIEGFPIGKDEDIIALSDAPYYTACPNPFIKEFIEENGTPYDEETDDYHREPFACDVSEGKNDAIYTMHNYHTKVPYKAIMRYILHYTEPKDVVYDGFSGTGMTGVASQMCECPDISLKVQIESELGDVNWGGRKVILNDLSPVAAFISYSQNMPADSTSFLQEAEKIIYLFEQKYGWMYETKHRINGLVQRDISGNEIKGFINYTVWSDVFICPNCSKEFVFSDVALDKENKHVADKFVCPHCGSSLSKRNCVNAKESYFDEFLKKTIDVDKQKAVLINYTVNGEKFEKEPDDNDFALIRKIKTTPISYWIPTCRLPEGGETRRNDKKGITNIHHFYTRRSLIALSYIMNEVEKSSKPLNMRFLFEQIILGMAKISRYVPSHFSQVNQYLSGTLYIGSQVVEVSPEYILNGKIKKLTSVFSSMKFKENSFLVSTSSTTDIDIPDNSIDYIFTDPPFGSNLNYSELNVLWEAWMRCITNAKAEAIVNDAVEKKLLDYQQLMTKCFKTYYRVLKPNHWMTVEFHNSKNAVWNAIQESIQCAGFIIADVRTLDKKQGTFKQINSVGAVKQDLVISAYKPKLSFVKNFNLKSGGIDIMWEFTNQYLENLPVAPDGNHNGKIDLVIERQGFLLYDRMVAWHIMHGVAVPMDAQEFYAGLDEHYIKRDDMYFLPEQVTEYDQKRAVMGIETTELAFLAITDEKNAIQWLNYQLQTPQSYAELQPLYLQELHQDKNEAIPELLDLLKENFLLNENTGKWYIPDITKAGDIAKLREKSLMKEFEGYLSGKGKLKVFRSEAIRLGIGKLWKEKNYKGIVDICKRLPEKTIQEDQSILMYYDNSLMRI